MKSYLSAACTALILLLTGNNLRAQCIGTSEIQVINLNTNLALTASVSIYGNYTTLNVEYEGKLILKTRGNYFTLTDESNNVLTHSSADFDYTFTTPGVYRLHCHSDASCGTGFIGEFDYAFETAEVIYSGEFFEDWELDNGTLDSDSTYVLTHSGYGGDSFTGTDGEDFLLTGKASMSNLPVGLTATLLRSNSSTLVLKLSGQVSSHSNADDMSNLNLTFDNSAFNVLTASETAGANKNDLQIEFVESLEVGSSATYTTIAAAVAAAEAYDVISLAAETFIETGISIDKVIRIKGQGPQNTIIKGHADYDAGNGRIFSVAHFLRRVDFKDLTMKNARIFITPGLGAAILSYSPLKIVNCVFEDNIADGSGGNNQLIGGAVYITAYDEYDASIVQNCLFNNNICRNSSSHAYSGALHIEGEAWVENCTFNNNGLNVNGNRHGGAMMISTAPNKHSKVVNCTFTGNYCAAGGSGTIRGGGLYFNQYNSTSSSSVINTIIYGNTATEGGDLYNDGISANVLNARNSIIGTSAGALGNAITGYDISNSSSDPLLGTLADHGGDSQTISIGSGSPAIDAGYTTDTPTEDQRGYCRGATRDIGAYELDGLVYPTVTSTSGDVRCGTGTINLTAGPSAGSINWYTTATGGSAITSGGNYTLSGNDLDVANVSASTTYYAEADNGNCVSKQRTAVVATINSCPSQLSVGSCDVTLTDLTQALYVDAVSGATNYRLELRSAIDNSFVGVITVGAASNMLRLSWSSAVKYGSNYRVRAAAYVDGTWQPYGPVCNVITPAPRLTDCNTVLTSGLDEAFTVTPVQGATDYRIDVRNYTAGFQKVSARGTADNTFRLSWMSGVEYGTTYQVWVSAKVNGSWKAYGPACTVTTPVLVKLENASCGITTSSLTQALTCNLVNSATNYLFEIRKASDNSLVATGTNSSNFYRLSWRPEIQYNTSYKIRVAVFVSGLWTAYGQSCTVTTPVSGMMLENESTDSKTTDLLREIRMETYPNPNDGSFLITTSHESAINILNELGQLIQTVEISKENNHQAEVKNLSPGIYFITGTINDEVITKKVVVK